MSDKTEHPGEERESGGGCRDEIPAPNLQVEGIEGDESKEERREDEDGGEGVPGDIDGDGEDGLDEREKGRESEGEEITGDARLWATLIHLSAILGLVLLKAGSSQPVVCLLGPLLIWLFKRDDHWFVDDQGKEAVNFQVILAVLGLILWIVPVIGPYLMKVLLLGDVGLALYAATQANQGRKFRYPWIPDQLRMLK
ncbi:MAG: DUF4870 domain-containing protein [Verrucomicrobiota bacterium]